MAIKLRHRVCQDFSLLILKINLRKRFSVVSATIEINLAIYTPPGSANSPAQPLKYRHQLFLAKLEAGNRGRDCDQPHHLTYALECQKKIPYFLTHEDDSRLCS